jgi:hypothetical protein
VVKPARQTVSWGKGQRSRGMTVMEGTTAGPELQKYGGTVFIRYARVMT